MAARTFPWRCSPRSCSAGARPAQPGEFTERAVLNGKLDLLRAEAIGDLIDARTRASHRMALQQLSGALSHRLTSLRAGIVEIHALLAYDLDFPGEDDGALPRRRVLEACDATIAALDELLATVPVGDPRARGRDGGARRAAERRKVVACSTRWSANRASS